MRTRKESQLRETSKMAAVLLVKNKISSLILFVLYFELVLCRICVNRECSEPISSAKVKKAFITKDVHLLVGDEVDIMSKSDDGNFFEFEIGDVKGTIPTSYVKETVMHSDVDALIHAPDEETGEDADNQAEEDMSDEIPNDAGDEDSFDPETEEVPPLETLVRPKKPKMKNDKVKQKQKEEIEAQNAAGKEDVPKPVQKENHEQGHMGDAQVANDVLKTETKEGIDSSNSKEEELKEVFKNEEEEMLDKLRKQVLKNSESKDENPTAVDSSGENKDQGTRKDENEGQLSEIEDMLRSLKAQAVTDQKEKDGKMGGANLNESTEDNVGKKIEEKNNADSSTMPSGEAIAPGAKIDAPVTSGSTINDAPSNNPQIDSSNIKETISETSPQLDEPMAGGLDPTSHSTGGVNFDEEMQKLPNFRIIKESHIRDYLASNYAGKDVNEETMKEVDAFIVNDMLKQLKEPDNDLLHMLLHYSEKDLLETAHLTVKNPEETGEKKDSENKEGMSAGTTEVAPGEGKAAGGASVTDAKETSTTPDKEGEATGRIEPDSAAVKDAASVEKSETKDAGSNNAEVKSTAAPLDADTEKSQLDSTVSSQEEQGAPANVDYTKHPNFEALKQKHIDKYLGLHYSPEEVTPQLLQTVEKFVTDDLSKQLKSADSPLRYELLGTKAASGAQELVGNTAENKQEELVSDKKEDAREIKVIQDIVISETSDNSKDEVESLPVPPAGGKDAAKPPESAIHASRDAERNKETSEDSKTEELNEPGSIVDDVIAKDPEAMKAAESDQVDNDGSDTRHESTTEESAGTPGKFSIKKIGNALKDRFKAFASKMLASSQEDKSDEGGSTSEAMEAGESDSRSESGSASSDDVTTTKVSADQGSMSTETDELTDKEQVSVADSLKEEDSRAKSEELERQLREAGRKLEESKKDAVADEAAADEAKSVDKEGGNEEPHHETEETRGGMTSDSNILSLSTNVPASSYVQDGDQTSTSATERDMKVDPNTPDLLSTLLNPDMDNEDDVEPSSSDSDVKQEEKSPDSAVNQSNEPAPELSTDVTPDKQIASENKEATSQHPSSEENRNDQMSEQRVTSDSGESDRNSDQVKSEEEITPDGKGEKQDATREERDIFDQVKDTTVPESGTLNEEVDAQDSVNVSSRKLLEDVNQTTDEDVESTKREEDRFEKQREANSKNEEGVSIVEEEAKATDVPAESGEDDKQVTNQTDSKATPSLHTIRDPSPEATRTEPNPPDLSDADVSVDSDTKQQGAHDDHQEQKQPHKDSQRNVPYDVGDEDSRAALLELCHNQQNLPACEQLRGAKIFRGKDRHVEPNDDKSEPVVNAEKEEEIGKLERLWRNLGKMMKRIKLMKLTFVKLFHGPLSVMGLEEISHAIHDQIEHASPEVITIIVCCFLLIFVLFTKSFVVPKHVKQGASAYDVHKMRQSRQRILQENTEDLENEIRQLREMLDSKDEKVSFGHQNVRDLENKLKSLQVQYHQQEPGHQASSTIHDLSAHTKRTPYSSSSSSSQLIANIRQEVQQGKKEQTKLHELIEEKEKEIHEADNVALRHQNEITRQTDMTYTLNERLEKVVEELDLKDSIVMELQEKNGALHVELENLEMERRQVEKERKEIAERCKELEETMKSKEEENAKLQDEIDEKENEVEVLRECMAQINNGKLDGEAVADFETPEDDPDIKEQLKTERLKQIVESTQALANLKKSEKEKEFFQEGYLEELEKRETAEEQVNKLSAEVEKLGKDANTYKISSTEIQIKLDTLQQYFKQQETELHRKLSLEEQTRQEYQRMYEAVIGKSSTAVEETAAIKLQNEDLKNEIKEMERNIKEIKIAAEKETHELWIKNRQINRDVEQMKSERDIYRKRLLEAETTRKRTSPITVVEKPRDSPAGSDDGRPPSPGSQKSSASGLSNFMVRPPFRMPPPPFPPRGPFPMGPMPPRPGPYGPPLPVPPMMGGPQNPMSGPPSSFSGAPNSMAGPPSMQGGPPGMQPGPQNMQPMPPNAMNQPLPFGSTIPQSNFQNTSGQPPNFMNAPPTTANAFMNQQMAMRPSLENSQNQNQRAPLSRADSLKGTSSNPGRQQGLSPGQPPITNIPQGFAPQSSSQTHFQSTPINSPNMSQRNTQLPPSHPSLAGQQANQMRRPPMQRRTTGSDVGQ